LEKLLREKDTYEKLSSFGQTLSRELKRTAQECGIALQVPHCGGMFALFFNENPVTDLEQATRSDPARAKKLFRYALENGVFLPPSPYESCFISTAHDSEALEKTVRVLCDGLRTL
jgi:glutamate-1-semialdehyde 2,1-aminomutase